jgi:CubicO group peptidase (beta-lactamase class C family)
MMRITSAAALTLALTAPVAAQQPDRAALVSRIDSLAQAWLADTHTPAVSIAVLRGRDTLALKGYGLADISSKRAAGATTIYRIGSITKQFTSAAIMRQVEQGKISLDDDMSKYLPDFPLHDHHVSIRQLLNHTSGIHSYTSNIAWPLTWSKELTPREIVRFVENDTFDFAPGTKWLYNNTGYVLLGMILEKVTGMPYAQYLQREFFAPLGLRRTSYCPSSPSDTAFAAGYAVARGSVAPAQYLHMSHPFSAGALCSTVGDFAMWQRALAGGRVVNARSFGLMSTPDTLNNGNRLSYGFGLVPGNFAGHRSIGHSGGVNGFTTASLYFPADTLNVVVFSNANGGPDPLALNLARAVLGLPLVSPPKPPVAVPLSDADREAVVGVYDLVTPAGGKFTIHVMVENGQLLSQAEGPGQGKFPLIHVGNLTFGAEFDPSLRLAFTRENGIVTSATLRQGATTMTGRKR